MRILRRSWMWNRIWTGRARRAQRRLQNARWNGACDGRNVRGIKVRATVGAGNATRRYWNRSWWKTPGSEQVRRDSTGMAGHGEPRSIERNETVFGVEFNETMVKELPSAWAKLGAETMFTRPTAHEVTAQALFAWSRGRGRRMNGGRRRIR